jgi:glycosyltransferase involved in cell wall biosynthesis
MKMMADFPFMVMRSLLEFMKGEQVKPTKVHMLTEKITVCHLAEKFPPEYSGSGKQAVIMTRALLGKDISGIAICSTPTWKSYVDHSCGFPILHIGSSGRGWLRSFQFAFRSMIWLLRNRDKYDLIHLHGYCWAAITSIVVGKLLAKKTLYGVAIPGDDDLQGICKSRFGRIKGLVFSRVDGFIANSSRVRKDIEAFGYPNGRIYLVPNGVDEKYCFDKRATDSARGYALKRYQFDENVKIISYMGSIQFLKGIDVLARAWPRIMSKIPEARLILVGPYYEHTEFHRWLIDLLQQYLGQSVFLVGYIEDPEVYYRASDVFVFPSRNESFGNVLVEAMACGTACVATRIDGVTDNILENGYNGLVVEQENHEALGDAILSVLRDPDLRDHLSTRGVQTVNDKFRMDLIAQKYQSLYSSLLAKDRNQAGGS